MRRSMSLRFSVSGLGAVTAAMLTVSCGLPALGGDGFSVSRGIVADLAGGADLEPLPAFEDMSVDMTAVETPAARTKSFARQSVPARDRAGSYRDGELFRNSKAAFPLLVADLEPKVVAVLRPMSGRSVGARPAAAWTRATNAAPNSDPGADSAPRSSAVMTSFGQR